MNNLSKIIKSFADSFQKIDFDYVFRDYYYVIKSIKIIENIDFEKLCFDTNYEITLADRE